MPPLFTVPDTWSGGHYEVAIALPDALETTAKAAVEKLWSHPTLEGCFLHLDVEPSEQQKFSPSDVVNEGHWLGVATLPNGKQNVCGSFLGKYDVDGNWLFFYLPLGALCKIYPVGGYPFSSPKDTSPEVWVKEVDEWFRVLASHVYTSVRFKAAIMGFEVDFFDVMKTLESGVPAKRWESLLVQQGGDLVWYPITIYDPPYQIGNRPK